MTATGDMAVSMTPQVRGEFLKVIKAFGTDVPGNLLELSQFLRREASRVEIMHSSEVVLEAQGQTSMGFKWCDPEE